MAWRGEGSRRDDRGGGSVSQSVSPQGRLSLRQGRPLAATCLLTDDVMPEAEEAGREDRVEDEEEEGEDGHGVVRVPLGVRVGGAAQAHKDGKQEQLPACVRAGGRARLRDLDGGKGETRPPTIRCRG